VREDARWKYGVPPVGNANFAWLQHILWHLAPHGTAGVVLANGATSSGQSGEDDIRRAMVEGDVVDCMIALPGQLFYSTQIPACLWFLARNKNPGQGWRDRRGEVLFIDARKLGHMVDRTRQEFTDEDIARIAGTYHAWRGETGAGDYEDIVGFCKAAQQAEIKAYGYVLTPGHYVGAADAESDGVFFADRFAALRETLEQQLQANDELTEKIRSSLRVISYADR
jgi:type I restriction enzyme M protein